jgi:hypothetical protein
MAAERRPQRFFNTEFAKMMQAEYAPEEKAFLSTEAGGFTGEIGLKIAQLQAEGLGKTIGVPSQMNVPTAYGAYQEIAYALPLTGEDVKGTDKQVLLVFPHEHGYDLAVASPLTVKDFNAAKENERLERAFDAIFLPSEEPHIFKGSWQPDQGERSVKMFVDRRRQFFAEYRAVPKNVTYEEILESAIMEARTRKKSEQSDVIQFRKRFDYHDPGQSEAA